MKNVGYAAAAALLARTTFGGLSGSAVLAADAPIAPDRPYAVTFAPRQARFVRVVVQATGSGSEVCLDELEVYGPDGRRNMALARAGARASASSCLPGYYQHQIAHLNDGEYGNSRSWIAASVAEEWAQIEMPRPTLVSKVVLSRDRGGTYSDRVPTHFEVRLSRDGREWWLARRVATRVAGGPGQATAFVGVVPDPPPPPEPGGAGVTMDPPGTDLRAAAGDALGFPNLALGPLARPAASSVWDEGRLPIHQVAHLTDGRRGNSHSWISAADPSWAEVDLGGVYWIYRVALGNDSSGRYRDRAATRFAILVATRYAREGSAPVWRCVARRSAGPGLQERTEFRFRPVQARWVRVAIEAADTGPARLDEIEVFGSPDPIPLAKIGPTPPPPPPTRAVDAQLRDAFVGEEHAWLKTYGRADLDPSLVPYNGRVKEYPRHVADDHLPLPPLSRAPRLDGRLNDACWSEASRGVARVAHPYDFDLGPLVTHELWAGRYGSDLCLALRTNRLLSGHVAVVSSVDGQGCGVVTFGPQGLVFTTYARGRDGQVERVGTTPIRGAYARSRTCFEVRLPLAWFPEWRQQGLRIGLGMGGRHTSPLGRPITFAPAPLSVAEQGWSDGRTFRVRLLMPAGSRPLRASVSALRRPHLIDPRQALADAGAPLWNGVLQPGRPRTLVVRARQGAIGPEVDVRVAAEGSEPYTLHLFRYDPLGRTLALMEGLSARLARKGLDVRAERHQIARLRARQRQILSQAPGGPSERSAFLEARLARRRLFFREPDLAALSRILFVKRHPFHPSHIYTDYTDAPFRPGGGVCVLHIPRTGCRLDPSKARVTTPFRAGTGIARDPVATFDGRRIYFGYRPSEEGYYHILAMNRDGSGLRQVTDGPFHDFYPSPLPDGGVAFISTRCTARVFCFRGGSSVLFRMGPEGEDIRPLSHASLSEWAPSVMRDGRIIWTRWEYVDKGADFSQTLWSIRPDGSDPELVFGNTIIQPNGYANGREVPGTREICCTLVSHFGDINGPIALIDITRGRMNPAAIRSITPEVPWPGWWPREECFRDPVPIARDYFLCAHAPRDRFGLFVIDRSGNRELLYTDPTICSMAPTPLRAVSPPPALPGLAHTEGEEGHFVVMDVNQGLGAAVPRGTVRYLRVVEEVRHRIEMLPTGEYRKDHAEFMLWYASPVDRVSGPYGWPTYVAKAPLGVVPVEKDGSASFLAPAGKTLYFQALDADFNEVQRMRSVVQLQPGETRTCVGCHEGRHTAPPPAVRPLALRRPPRRLAPPSWGPGPFSYEQVVQPVLDARCVSCHNASHPAGLDLTATHDADRIPASYRTLISRGLVHYVDCGWNSGGCEKRQPLTFGTVKSRLWRVLEAGHHGVRLTFDEALRLKTWVDLNCPLWPDYVERPRRPLRAVPGA